MGENLLIFWYEYQSLLDSARDRGEGGFLFLREKLTFNAVDEDRHHTCVVYASSVMGRFTGE